MSENLQNPKSNDHKSLQSTTHKEYLTDIKQSLLGEETPHNNNEDASNKCKHPTHRKHLSSMDLMNLMPSEYWENYLRENHIEATGEVLSAEQVNHAINEVFVKRIQELESRAPNILEAKVETYKDWITVQQRVNEALLNDFDMFERTLQQHLQSHETTSNYNFHRDIATLVEIIKQAFRYNKWSLAGLKFESMKPASVMGLNENSPQDREILDQLLKGEYHMKAGERDVRPKRLVTDVNVMALADEVAEKHDEINRLKQQICALDDEIQNAQKKIQLKDDVIKELRLDLKNFNKFLVQENVTNTTKATSVREESSATKENVSEELMMSQQQTTYNVEKLNPPKATKSQGMSELIRNQLQEILTNTNWQMDCSSNEAECLKKVFMKLEKDKNEAQERLKKLKQGLLEFVMPSERGEQNLIIRNNDEFLIRAVQAHIESINLSHEELKGQVQQLLIEKGATAGKLEALNNINRINCEALEKLADLLSSLTNEPVNYEEIYDSNSKNNPFCAAIRRIHSKLTKQIQDLTEELAAERDRFRMKEQETLELDKAHEETSSSKLCCIKSSSRTPQRTHTELSPSTAPRPHPRQKLKKLERKN